MPDLNVILSGLAYALLTGIFNAIFAHKSQINAWAEANPRLAGLLKITRAIGLDPQHLWAAGALIIKGRLPKVQTDPPDEKLDDTVSIIPIALLCLVGLSHQACAGVAPTVKPGCDEASLGVLTTACGVEAFECGKSGKSEAECTAACDWKLDERAKACQ